MARYTGPKNRIARRFGANIFGRLRNPLLHKPHAPGMHGAKRKKRSDYGTQLNEKQKLRAIYGMISQKKLVQYYKEAVRRKEGTPADNLMEQLECRLDNIVFRMKIGSTIFQAQQLVSHGHILVNGKKVDIRSFQVKPGMRISVKEKTKNLTFLKQNQDMISREVPEYLSWDPKKFEGEMLTTPGVDQIPLPLPINIPLVCEFLAHTTS